MAKGVKSTCKRCSRLFRPRRDRIRECNVCRPRHRSKNFRVNHLINRW